MRATHVTQRRSLPLLFFFFALPVALLLLLPHHTLASFPADRRAGSAGAAHAGGSGSGSVVRSALDGPMSTPSPPFIAGCNYTGPGNLWPQKSQETFGSGLLIECRNAGFSTLPAGIPADVVYIALAFNNITVLQETSFRNMTLLQRLGLIL